MGLVDFEVAKLQRHADELADVWLVFDDEDLFHLPTSGEALIFSNAPPALAEDTTAEATVSQLFNGSGANAAYADLDPVDAADLKPALLNAARLKAGQWSDLQKANQAEAKANGFDTKTLRQVVRLRKQDSSERMEQEALLDLYLNALGMAIPS